MTILLLALATLSIAAVAAYGIWHALVNAPIGHQPPTPKDRP